MSRFTILLLGVLYTSPLTLSAPSVHTVFSPFSFSPSVEILRSPVTKVETINLTPIVSRSGSSSASAVAIAGGSYSRELPVVQRIESYNSGDSSNAEIRNLLRNLLSELRTSNTKSSDLRAPTQILSDSYGPPSRNSHSSDLRAPTSFLSDSYGPPSRNSKPSRHSAPQSFISDSYGAPPRNTISDPNGSTYPDSFDNSRRFNNNHNNKPEKVVTRERQSERLVSETPTQFREVVRTVYQPVYVPVPQYAQQYAQQYVQPEVLTVSQPVQQLVSAVPTRVNTGTSAVAISTIHSSPAYAIQQEQQLSLPLVQSVQAQLPFTAAYASAGTVLDDSSGGSGYGKK